MRGVFFSIHNELVQGEMRRKVVILNASEKRLIKICVKISFFLSSHASERFIFLDNVLELYSPVAGLLVP